MTRIAARVLLVLVPVTILAIVGASALAARSTRLGVLLLNLRDRYTSQAEIDVWDIPTGRSARIVRYDQNFVGPTAGWSWPVFSPDGRWIAYVRQGRGKQWIGVSDSLRWQPREFFAQMPPLAQNARLTWLPSSQGLLVSYTIGNPAADFETVVGRQFLDLSSTSGPARLVDWPFVCERLIDDGHGLMLRCPFQSPLRSSSGAAPTGMAYALASGQWQAEPATPAHDFFPLDDLLHPNWAYSRQGGLTFYGTVFDGAPGGLNRMPPDSDHLMRLPFDLTRRPRLAWLPDGSRLLVEQDDSRVWAVYDVAQNREIARLEDADIDVTIGCIWVHDADHIAYLVLPSGTQPETLHVRALDIGSEITLPLPIRLTDMAWVYP